MKWLGERSGEENNRSWRNNIWRLAALAGWRRQSAKQNINNGVKTNMALAKIMAWRKSEKKAKNKYAEMAQPQRRSK